jgi:protein-disulfide isomerase
VYSDFQCPYCRAFATKTLPTIRREYVDTGRLLLAFRHFPLEKIHPYAFRAAVMTECARRQNKFWQLHDRLFEAPLRPEDGQLRSRAEELGLNLAQLDSCIEGSAPEVVRNDLRTGGDLGLFSTPTLLLGKLVPGGVKVTKVVSGAMPEPALKRELDELLRAPAPTSAAR